MRMRSFMLILALVLSQGTGLMALPVLQLDIVDGVYDLSTSTTVATSPVFTLRALLKSPLQSGTFYISAAISPGQAQVNPVPNFGTVVIDGTQYNPADYIYGTPPVDVLDSSQGNLATHGIFPTYYLEKSFVFDSAHTVSAYNVQTDLAVSGVLYYHDFTVDVSSLGQNYTLHFDLYNEGVKNSNYGVVYFAPFTHDAESGHSVPDNATTLVLIGLGFVILAFMWVKKGTA